MKKVLITGSEGIIGKVLQVGLRSDYDLVGLDLRGRSELEKYYQVDIAERDELERFFEIEKDIETVIHLAADSFVEADWDYVLPANIVGVKNIYQVAAQAGVSRVVLASSTHATGEGSDEEQKRSPKNWYGLSKAFGEDVARLFYDWQKLSSIVLRIGAVLENDKPESDLDKKIWLSQRDLIGVVKKAIETDLEFGIYNVMSDNSGNNWDIGKMITELKYLPQDGYNEE